MKKIYKYPAYKARYKFDRAAILNDFQFLHEFKAHYGVSEITFQRGITKLENHSHIPTRYFIDTQAVGARIWLGKGIILAKNKQETTHILEVVDGKVVLKVKKSKKN